MNLLEKYKPKSINDLIIKMEKINEIKRLVLERKPVIISGPAGCGKTTLAHLLAKDINYEILEINASEDRNRNKIEEILKPATKEASLFAKGRLILVDDVEALSGSQDRGGIATLINMLNQTKWPIIFTTTDHTLQKLVPIRKKSALVELEKTEDKLLFSYLVKILDKEKILYDPITLEKIVLKSNGDIRAALNDSQASIKEGVLDFIEGLGEREKTRTISAALSLIFRGGDFKKVIESFNDIDLDEAMLWLDENIPREFSKKDEIFRAYINLSQAGIFDKRIKRFQYYRFLVYKTFFMTAGISLAGNSSILNLQTFKRSTRPLKYFLAAQKNIRKKEIAKKIAEKTHCSTHHVIKNVIPLIKKIYQSGNEINDLKLTQEEIDWLSD